jgi:transposase-like protein
MIDSYISVNQASNNRQGLPNTGINLQPEQKVHLYGDTEYTGTLIRPIERTYPPKWTVQLDRGGYEAVNTTQISVIESALSNQVEQNYSIPFSDEPEVSTSQLESQLQKEIIALRKENAQLRQENEILSKDLEQAKQILRRAKDVSPIMRLSLRRVMRLAHQACMDVQRTVGGWILRMGNTARKFRRLADIWDLLSQDEFYLSDIFPEDKLIAVELIVPPRMPKRPTPPDKTTFPLRRPEDIMRQRTVTLVKC